MRPGRGSGFPCSWYPAAVWCCPPFLPSPAAMMWVAESRKLWPPILGPQRSRHTRRAEPGWPVWVFYSGRWSGCIRPMSAPRLSFGAVGSSGSTRRVFSEQALDVPGNIVAGPVLALGEFTDDTAVLDNVSFRILEGSVLGADVGAGVAGGLETERNPLQEIPVLLFVLVHANGHDYYARVRELPLKQVQRWNFLDTRGAPRRPEIQHQDFAAERSRSHPLALIGNDRESGGGTACFRRVILQAVADEAGKSRHQNRQNGFQSCISSHNGIATINSI